MSRLNNIKRSTPPPIGYYIIDFEKEIRLICKFLEDEGMSYSLINEFEIRYSSEYLVLKISFERYGGTVCVDYQLLDDGKCEKNSFVVEDYSIGWTISEYKNGILRKKYLKKSMSKLEEISAYMQFFKDYRTLLLNKDFADEMKSSYGEISI